jgi:hypothetical protein
LLARGFSPGFLNRFYVSPAGLYIRSLT